MCGKTQPPRGGRFLSTVLAFGISFVSTNTALADECVARQDMVQALEDKYGESLVATGVVNPNVVLEVFVSEAKNTWTILATGTDGKSCVITAGESWEQMVNGIPALYKFKTD